MTPRSRPALCLALAAGLSGAASAEVTLINVFEVPQGQLQAVEKAWAAARDFLQDEPGYIDTALHRALDDTARFRLVNVAHWDSPEAFRAAIEKMRAAGVFQQIEGLVATPMLYQVVVPAQEAGQ